MQLVVTQSVIQVQLVSSCWYCAGNVDYDPLMGGVLVFDAGSTDGETMCASITIIDDNIPEETETFIVDFEIEADTPNVIAHTQEANVRIVDNDGILFKPTIEV